MEKFKKLQLVFHFVKIRINDIIYSAILYGEREMENEQKKQTENG